MAKTRRNRKPNREPPKVFRWFFGYHAFDVEKARELAADKPTPSLTTVCIAPLLVDGPIDLDVSRSCDPNGIAILARVPIGDGNERYLLVDGYEVANKCARLGRDLRLRLLSRREAKACRIDSESSGEWPQEG